MGIRGKMILLVGGTVVAFGALSLLGLYRFWSITRERMDDVLVKRVEASALAYDQWIESQKRQTIVLASALNGSRENVEFKNLDLQTLSTKIDHFDGLFFIDASGSVVQSSVDSLPLQPDTVTRLLEATKKEKTPVLATYEGDAHEFTRLFVAAPTAGGGAVVVQIDGNRLGEVFDDIRLSEGSVVSVFDPEGNVLYRRAGTDRSFDPRVTSKGLVDSIREKPYTITEDFSPHDGIKRVYGVARAGDGESIVAIGQAADRYYSPLWNGLYQRIAIAALIMIVSVATTLLVAISIVGPIRMLQKATSAFASGDRGARAKTNASGELGELARGFNTMAEQINAREDSLREADRLRSEYVSSVSHELKTPLTTIKTLTRVLESNDSTEEDRRQYLRMIDAECDRQIGFVSDLLDAAVIEGGNVEIELTNVELPAVLKEAMNSERSAAITKDLQLVLESVNGVPLINSNSNSLVKIFRILIENAITYSPAGSQVRASTSLYDSEIGVSISDCGCGIDDSDMPFIFNKFYRGKKRIETESNGNSNGVGLGLFIAQGLAAQIGGRIEAENRPAGGATFTVFVPIENRSANVSSNFTG